MTMRANFGTEGEALQISETYNYKNECSWVEMGTRFDEISKHKLGHVSSTSEEVVINLVQSIKNVSAQRK